MRYTNPIVKGFYPDPSVCFADGKYYMVCSSFQYFPGVPLFESENLVNWTQIGHVLTRKSQVMLEKIESSGGVFAPTIRYYNNRFYMVTTNNTTQQNFYVYTDDIHSEWSEPIYVDQGGIDPSLYFEDGKAFFMSNGCDDNGVNGITQCEIDIETGKKLTESRSVWQGTGGRFLESPHLYKINNMYYIMAAEGGTEYGHMITYARGTSVFGPFENAPHNPVLTNRNKAPYIIQGIGHGDLIQDQNGNWYILSLGFRQQGLWMPYHQLGREVFLTPVIFDENGWFFAGNDGTTDESYEITGAFVQNEKKSYTFSNTDWHIDWCFLRHPHMENYEFSDKKLLLHGTDVTLDETDSPTFIGLRQKDFTLELCFDVHTDAGEAGITFYMTEDEHYDLALCRQENGFAAVLKLNIGGIKHTQTILPLTAGTAKLLVRSTPLEYHFFLKEKDTEILLGTGRSKYLTSEVSGGFTGVIMALYATGSNTAAFENFTCTYQ